MKLTVYHIIPYTISRKVKKSLYLLRILSYEELMYNKKN